MKYEKLAADFLDNINLLAKAKRKHRINADLHGEMFVLDYICRHRFPVLPGEISSFMIISSARIAAALNSLEAKEFIVRQSDTDDRRQILVSATEKGKKVAEETRRIVIAEAVDLLKVLDEDEAKEYVRITGVLAERLSLLNLSAGKK